MKLIEAARGFASPVGIEFEQAGQKRMFVIEQGGRIRITAAGRVLPTPFLDISRLLSTGGERGLLGMALPPGFASKQYFYVDYTNAVGNTVIARFRVSASDPNIADAASQEVILEIAQPAANHNGGRITFGPDGYLYIGMGDGGGSNDQFQNGQNKQSLLGKLLRIDVEGSQKPYGVPASNPFVGNPQYRPEIWALGLRNPWRFSFDRKTGDLWIADVGQDRAEEIDFQPASSKGGENYGWPIMEGLGCLTGTNCNQAGLTLPKFEYTHTDGNISITGGFAYRGVSPGLPRGTYVFADYGSGRIWQLGHAVGLGSGVPDTDFSDLLDDESFNISSFGEDSNGDIFVIDDTLGVIYRIDFLAAVNGASFDAGITPGSPASVFAYGMRDSTDIVAAQSATLPTILGGLQVLVNSVPAPLYAVTDRQINFQVPFDLALTDVNLRILRNGEFFVEIPTKKNDFQPGIFSYGGTSDAIAVHSSNFTLVDADHPAERGEYITFYAAGLGAVNGVVPTGAATPFDRLYNAAITPDVAIGGVPCEVQFAGLAPGLVGVYQMNVKVAPTVPSGSQVLVVSKGAVGVTANVRIR